MIDRIAVANTSFGVWHTGGEKLERIMGRQAIPMVFDYPESNPFCNSTGSASNQIDWIVRYINDESNNSNFAHFNNASSGDKAQFGEKEITAVITDPPYYDAIAYADLSDFFYVWLKRTLADIYPENFTTPQTPKTEECTALKHHHENNAEASKKHFEDKLYQIFDAIEHQTSDIVSIMFAHQSTEAWTTLCNSILKARMNIMSSWANDTEMTGALKTDKAFLSSSVTVSCRPSTQSGIGDYAAIRTQIEAKVKEEVIQLYALGFRGADLLTACFGQAVSVFGGFASVEKADGSLVTVAELLQMARDSAYKAIVSDIDADEYTRFYIGWLNLYGFSAAEHDDVLRLSQIGLSIDRMELNLQHLVIHEEDQERLASFEYRVNADKNLGNAQESIVIDKAHRLMALYKEANPIELHQYIALHASVVSSPVWRLLASLVEVLPKDSSDHTQVSGLLTDRDSLILGSKTVDIHETATTKDKPKKQKEIEEQGTLL